MSSRPPRPATAQPNLSSEELAWVGSVAERYDALVFHWVGPLTGSYFFLLPRRLWQTSPATRPSRARRARRARRTGTA
jgi:hypothetical protein